MLTSIKITIVIDLRSDTEQQQSYMYFLHVTVARTTIVLSYKPGSLSDPAGPCGISIGGRACSNSLLQRRDLSHLMILHLYKAISIKYCGMEYKCRQNTAGVKQMGRAQCKGLFFFSFCPSIGHQKNEKGSGRYRRRRDRKREKERKKRKKERGGSEEGKICKFLLFFFKCCVVYYKVMPIILSTTTNEQPRHHFQDTIYQTHLLM